MYTDMSVFFKTIADRMWKENDLSDMTFALCQSNPKFKQFFLDFFFPDEHLEACTTCFRREVAIGDSRPDFWIEVEDGRVYLVEVKIWDRNQHFSQYLKLLSNPDFGLNSEEAYRRIGYIANYTISATDAGYSENVGDFKKFRTPHEWSEFYCALEKMVSVDEFAGGDYAIVGYLHYLRNLCGMKKYDAEQPVGKSMRDAIAWLEKTTDEALRGVEGVTEYNRSSSCIDFTWRKGRFFMFDAEGTIYGFVGVYFGAPLEKDNPPRFAVVLTDEQGWGRIACNKHRSQVHDGGLWFYPTEDDAKDMAEFIRRVVRYVRGKDETAYPGRTPTTLAHCRVLRNIKLYDRMMKLKVLNFEGEGFKVKYYQNPRPMKDGFGEYFQIDIPSKSIQVWAWTGFISSEVGPVIRFRGDWDKQGIFASEREKVILPKEDVTIEEYAIAFRNAVTELILSHVEGTREGNCT